MCDFCEKYDFGLSSWEVDKYGARIINASGSYWFPEYRQFLFCPVCGQSRVKKNILPPVEKRECPSYYNAQPYILN